MCGCRKTAAVLLIFVFLSSVFPVAASGQGRDVAVANVLTDPSEPQPGDVVTTGVTVANLGNAPLKGVPVTLCVNGSQVGSTQYVDLEAGSAIVVQFEWSPQSYGSYTIVGAAGPVNGESDATNNQATTTLTISEPAPATDNQASDASISEPAPADTGDSGVEVPTQTSPVPTPTLTTSRLAESASAAAKTIEAEKQRTAHKTVEAEVQGIDVSARDFVLTPRNPSPGDTVAVRMTVANTGTAPLNDIPVKLLVDGAQVGETQYVDNLPRGETATVEFEWVPEDFGSYSLVGVAGPLDGEQRNPLNNFASAVVSISSVTVVPEQSITTSKLADAAVTAAKLASDLGSLRKMTGGLLSLVHASPEIGLQVRGPLLVTEYVPPSPVIMSPSGSGTYTQFETIVGETVHWMAVDDNVPDDSNTYVASQIPNNADTFALTNSGIPIGSTVDNVVVHVRARRVSAANNDWYIMILSGVYEDNFPIQNSDGIWRDYSNTWAADPNTGQPWTITAVDNLEAGARVNTGVQVTQVYVEVYYAPPAPENIMEFQTTAENYSVSFNKDFNMYFNWSNLPKIRLTPDGSIILDNSIYYSGGIYQSGVRGIPTEDIRDNAVTTAKIAPEAVARDRIATNVLENIDRGVAAYDAFPIGADNMASDVLDNIARGVAAYEAFPIGRENLAAGVVENMDLGRAAHDRLTTGILTENILDLAVTGNKIANATIDAAKLNFNVYKFLNVADNTGQTRFNAESVNDSIQFMGGGATSVSFDDVNKRIIISSPAALPGAVSITAENGLTAGSNPITGVEHIGIADNGVTPNMLAENAESLSRVTGGLVWIENQTLTPGGWWNNNWTRRRKITINGAHPENYQIRIVVPHGLDMLAGYGDLRFLENENSGVLPYWIENYTADNVTVWVRRLENLDGDIYAYYGNSGAASVGNGENTFVFFDNFSGSSLNTAKWSATGNPVVENGILEVRYRATYDVVTSNVIWSAPMIYEAKVRMNEGGPVNQAYQGVLSSHGVGLEFSTYSNITHHYILNLRSTVNDVGPLAGYWYTYQIWRSGSAENYMIDNYTTSWTTEDTGSYPINFSVDSRYYGGEVEVDWVFIRKYAPADPKPSVGEEENVVSVWNVTSLKVSTDRGIYYTGGLYSGLGAVVRGIPTEDIMDSAVTSRKIADNTIRLEDLSQEVVSKLGVQGPPGPTGATGPAGPQGAQGPPGVTPSISAGAGLYASLSGTTWTVGIADGGVSLSKLKIGGIDLDLGPGRGEGHDLYYFFPTFWGGRETTYLLSDFGVRAKAAGVDSWHIYNSTSSWRYLRLNGITNSPFGFFIGYSPENGQINVVVKGDLSMDNAISPGSVFYDIRNNSLREEILSNPENFIFDLEERTVRRVVS